MIEKVLALPQVVTMPADFQGIGYALADLACLYQGQEVPNRPDNRLWLALEALRGNKTLPPTPVSGKHIHMLSITVHVWQVCRHYTLYHKCVCGQVCKHYTLYHKCVCGTVCSVCTPAHKRTCGTVCSVCTHAAAMQICCMLYQVLKLFASCSSRQRAPSHMTWQANIPSVHCFSCFRFQCHCGWRACIIVTVMGTFDFAVICTCCCRG